MDFAPEVWLALIGLTLGTLVIVISIASQAIPKIAELYMQDWVSLLYIWFLILGGAHAVYVKFHREADVLRTSSVTLNLYFFLPIAIVVALPYIFYVLRSIQPDTVINRIFKASIRHINHFTTTDGSATDHDRPLPRGISVRPVRVFKSVR